MTCKSVNVTSILNEVDTMLSGSCSQDQPKAGTILTAAMQEPSDHVPEGQLFSKYLVTPAYRAEMKDGLLVKLSTAKGEPFYLIDPGKVLKPLVCGLTEIFLAPYDAETACADECDGLPALHIVPECIAKKLFTQALKGVCTARQFTGIVFVSSVGLQFYYKGKDCSMGDVPMINSVYRVAADAEGHIEAREVRGVVTCDYPVPYLLVDEEVFSAGTNTTAIVESLTQANAQLIDTLCKLEYVTLHEGEDYPGDLEALLGGFMSNHSHRVKGLLDAQLTGAGSVDARSVCDDAFVRRQRKTEIDNLVRLMMREVELMEELKHTLEELSYVAKMVQQCPPPLKISTCPTPASMKEVTYEDPCGMKDPLLDPLMKIRKEDLDEKARKIVADADIESIEEMIAEPLSDSEKIADGEMLDSPSGSECSR